MKDAIKQSIAQLEACGFDSVADRLRQLESQVINDHFKVALIGEFKTGKSTLINRIFLGRSLLFTDIEEATAVPTELTYGPDFKMEVFHYKQRKEDFEIAGVEPVTVAESIDEPLVFPEPTTEVIRKYTAGDSIAAKEQLALTTSHVRIETPDENLRGFTLIDTPGVNSGTQAVLSTVFRVLPQLDLVVFVKKAVQFTQAELEFLSSRAFEQTGTRGMILVNEDPRFSALDEAQRSSLRKAMEAQLRNIGRLHLPFEWVRIPFDHKERTRIKITRPEAFPDQQSEVSSGDVSESRLLERILANVRQSSSGNTTGNDAPAETDLSGLADRLIRYLQMNAPQGRRSRLKSLILRELESSIELCKMELSNLCREDTDLEKVEFSFDKDEAEMRLRYLDTGKSFVSDLSGIHKCHMKHFSKALEALMDRYEEDLSGAGSLFDLIEVAKRIEAGSRDDIESVIYTVSDQTRSEMEKLKLKYEESMKDQFANYLVSRHESDRIHGGMLVRIPVGVYYAIDFVITTVAVPLGPWGDMIMRGIATLIPVLKNLTPTQLAKGLVRNSVVKNIRKSVVRITEDSRSQMRASLDQAENDILNGWEDAWDNHVKSVRESFVRARTQRTESHREDLKQCISVLDAAQASLR